MSKQSLSETIRSAVHDIEREDRYEWADEAAVLERDAAYWQEMHAHDAGAMADKWRKAEAEKAALEAERNTLKCVHDALHVELEKASRLAQRLAARVAELEARAQKVLRIIERDGFVQDTDDVFEAIQAALKGEG